MDELQKQLNAVRESLDRAQAALSEEDFEELLSLASEYIEELKEGN